VAVDASDLSADALAVARINVERHGLQERITAAPGRRPGPALQGPYDLILCNPPYVNAASMAALPPEYRAEPALALAGGADGMDFVRACCATPPRAWRRQAPCWCWRSATNAPTFEAAFPRLEPVWLDTSAGEDQVLLLTREALTDA
jgi:ribosomal protein L3 glutamine methyltransferase